MKFNAFRLMCQSGIRFIEQRNSVHRYAVLLLYTSLKNHPEGVLETVCIPNSVIKSKEST